jgi:hypothetical protein
VWSTDASSCSAAAPGALTSLTVCWGRVVDVVMDGAVAEEVVDRAISSWVGSGPTLLTIANAMTATTPIPATGTHARRQSRGLSRSGGTAMPGPGDASSESFGGAGDEVWA